jgi:beta-N-acetylhexosaminidase
MDLTKLNELVGRWENQEFAQKFIDSAITLVRDEQGILPLKLASSSRLLHLNILDAPAWNNPPGRVFYEELKKRFKNCAQIELRGNAARQQYRQAEQEYKKHDAVIISTAIRISANKGSIDLNLQQVTLLKKLAKGKKPFVFALFGSPYLLAALPELPSYILAYDYYPEAEIAVVKAIAGEIPFRGKLPVQIPSLYPIGYALKK